MVVEDQEPTLGSSVAHAERCLENLGIFEHLEAFLCLNPMMLDEAKSVDRRHEEGEYLPLRSVVVAVKDNIETAGLNTTGGAVALKDYVPRRDAFALRRLKQHGAVVIGKTNLDELAGAGSTLSSLGGQSLNPYDPSRTPAGSSGGSAIAVAIGACNVALGTETVNSIRNPAHVCGVFGLRPSRGLIARSGTIPVSPTMDVLGPLAGTLEDLALAFRMMIGFDPDDAVSLAARDLDRDGLKVSRWPKVEGMRIGVLKGLFGKGEEHVGINRCLDAAFERLRSRDVVVVEIEEPRFNSLSLYNDLALHAHEFESAFDGWLSGLNTGAPIRSFRAYVEDGRWPHSTMHMLLKTALDADRDDAKLDYARKIAAAKTIRMLTEELMQGHRLDALAYPAQHRTALLIGEQSRPERNGVLASALGWPAINVPVGQADGLPVGLDLMAVPFQEALLFSLAKAVQGPPVRPPIP
ncbi:amidase [Agrobacterium vitis]|nr:amidase [Agrobacterium vitis]NSY12208.1 amidase [Agrobacterium vitis]NSY22037.1 amidase [Agrobacterium vitis]NTA21738.1 amidase [Agrobacterium vitis]WEO73323.1 amidase [Agrobacterium vitis]